MTQEQFLSLLGRNPSNFRGPEHSDGDYAVIGGEGHNLKHPVEQATYYDAIEYANALSKLKGLRPAYEIIRDANGLPTGVRVTADSIYKTEGYRLPTEAEMEYATRAGTQTPYSFEGEQMDRNGWHKGNSGGRTHAVGMLRPNALGFYDLAGNVWRWMHDTWTTHLAVYQVNPQRAEPGADHVVRGGSWYYGADLMRSAARFHFAPGYRHSSIGFRLARSIH